MGRLGPGCSFGMDIRLPFMLVICFLAGLVEYPSSSEIENGRAINSSPKPRYFGDSTDRPIIKRLRMRTSWRQLSRTVVLLRRNTAAGLEPAQPQKVGDETKAIETEYIGGWYRDVTRTIDWMIYISSAPCVAKWQSSSYFTGNPLSRDCYTRVCAPISSGR